MMQWIAGAKHGCRFGTCISCPLQWCLCYELNLEVGLDALLISWLDHADDQHLLDRPHANSLLCQAAFNRLKVCPCQAGQGMQALQGTFQLVLTFRLQAKLESAMSQVSAS